MRKNALLSLIIIVVLGIIFWNSLAYRYELQGELVDLQGCRMQLIGYTEEEGTFTVTSEDPQFILTELPCAVGGLRLRFKQAWAGAEPLQVQVFYAKSDAFYSERYSVKGVLKEGERELLLPLPLSVYQSLRFDIDGNFALADITGCCEKMKVTPYISADTVRQCLWYFPAAVIGLCLLFWAHGVRRKEGAFCSAKAYAKYVFLGAEPTADRADYFDYLRVCAVLLVLLAHACSPRVAEADADWKRFVLICGLSLGLCCNLLYVMLSGALLLRRKNQDKEGISSFYLRRVSKIVIPLVAYYFLLLSFNKEVAFLPPQHIGSTLKRIVSGAPDVAPHLWLIYSIISLYLVTPFFRVMVQHMSDRMLFSLAAVIFGLNVITTYLPLFGMSFGAASFLSRWEGIFLLGYIMTRRARLPNAAKCYNRLLFGGILAYCVMVAVVFADAEQMNYVYNSAPTMMAASCGIFAFFLKNKEWFRGRQNPLVRLCSKYSYAIILVHWHALFGVVQGRFHITALRFGCIGGIVATVLGGLAVSIVMAVIYDNTVVIVCSVLFDKIVAHTGAFLRIVSTKLRKI